MVIDLKKIVQMCPDETLFCFNMEQMSYGLITPHLVRQPFSYSDS